MVFKEFEGYVFSGSLFVDVIAWSSWIVVYPLYFLFDVWWEVVTTRPLTHFILAPGLSNTLYD